LCTQAWELARALRNLPHDLVKYKTIAAFKDQALAYLDKISMAPQVWLNTVFNQQCPALSQAAAVFAKYFTIQTCSFQVISGGVKWDCAFAG
jgi:hypothetical protein